MEKKLKKRMVFKEYSLLSLSLSFSAVFSNVKYLLQHLFICLDKSSSTFYITI